MCSAVDINENQTMPGSSSHKVDVVNQQGEVRNRVESWLRGVGVLAGTCGDGNGACRVNASKSDESVSSIVLQFTCL